MEAVDGDGIDLAFPASKQRRGRVQRQIANTLDTSSNKGVAIYSPRVIGGIGEKSSNSGRQYFYQNRIYDSGVATAVATSLQPNYLDSAFRVRKLTPKECWRLMGFDDKSFEKAERVCSNTQLYKQAGNSIVVDVLERILENLLQDRPWETESITRSEWLDKLLEVV